MQEFEPREMAPGICDAMTGRIVTCADCGSAFEIERVVPLANVDELGARLTPGDEVPAGACPDETCEALCYLEPLKAHAAAALRVLDAIHAELSGREWSADTLDAIADHLRAAGYTIEEPEV